MRPARLTAILALLLGLGASCAWANTELKYKQRARQLRAVPALTAQEVTQIRQKKPTATFDLRGQVSGILISEEQHLVMVTLADSQCLEVHTPSLPTEIQAGVRIRCLARGQADSQALLLEMAIIDTGKPPVVKKPAAAPPTGAKSQVTNVALLSLPSRGVDPVLLMCKRAIVHFNPKLSAREINQIAENIVDYSYACGVDPYLVVAVVAAESRFRPEARSYKGAMGLGQLMPGTARGMGVSDPYDPAQNLAAAIRILQKNLDKYRGQPHQVALALAAYNAGSGAVKKYGGVPPYRETHDYIWKVYDYYCWMYGVAPESRPK